MLNLLQPFAKRIEERRKNLAVDVTVHLNDLQEMVIGEYAESLGLNLEECIKMVMECELDDRLASLGAIIERTKMNERPAE